jgi:hypothetical protein
MNKLALLAALVTITTQLNAFEIDTKACAGIEHIEDQSGSIVPYDPALHTFVTEDTPVFYAGEEAIPHLEIESNTHTTIFVMNTTDSIVSFFYKPTFRHFSTGAIATTPAPVYGGNFSSTNNPLSGEGANLTPFNAGTIHHPKGSSHSFGNSIIQWDSSTCFNAPPLMTSVRVMWINGRNGFSGTGISYFMVNNGKRW